MKEVQFITFVTMIPRNSRIDHAWWIETRIPSVPMKEGRLYGVRHMVKDYLDSETGNPLSPHGLLFTISSKGSLICIIPQTE